jgi:hypothetical protein
MMHDANVRKTQLTAIRSGGEAIGREKLYYKGKTREFDVYRIDLDFLIYNRHNGRIEAEMLTWEQEHSVAYDEYDDELHQRIDDFLWESNEGRNRATLKDLEKKGQQKSGIVSLDGVVIDGNRRSMLLRRLEAKTNQKQYLDAIILPDSYADNQTDIVRMETQYQLGEDSKVEYGALQKYLHVRRLHRDLGISLPEIDELMGDNSERLLEIMDLMDDYLEHIGCPRLYLMLKDRDGGTKEGMFVDLYADLKRLENGSAKIEWAFDSEIDPLQLKLIQFDYIRLGDFSDAKKVYRNISHASKGKNFFANEKIWEGFSKRHVEQIDPISQELPLATLEQFIQANPEVYTSKMDAAQARDEEWSQKAQGPMTGNFNQANYRLDLTKEVQAPEEYLRRARDLLEKIDLRNEALYSTFGTKKLVQDINKMAWEMKKSFDQHERSS